MEMELAPVPGESMSLADIERRLGELNNQTRELVAESARAEDATACTAQLRAVMNEAAVLKEKRALIEEQRQSNAQAVRRIEDAAANGMKLSSGSWWIRSRSTQRRKSRSSSAAAFRWSRI